MLDDFDLDVPEEDDDDDVDDIFEDDDQEGGGVNRNFMLVAGGLGGLLLISLICIGIYALVIAPNRETASPAELTLQAQQSVLNQSLTETSQAVAIGPSATPTVTPSPTNTVAPPTATETATVDPSEEGTLAPATDTPEGGPTQDPRTATVQALLTQASVARTQAAQNLLTTTATATSTALPDTGFLDDYGPIGMFLLTILMVMVIFMARRMRLADI